MGKWSQSCLLESYQNYQRVVANINKFTQIFRNLLHVMYRLKWEYLVHFLVCFLGSFTWYYKLLGILSVLVIKYQLNLLSSYRQRELGFTAEVSIGWYTLYWNYVNHPKPGKDKFYSVHNLFMFQCNDKLFIICNRYILMKFIN